MPRGTQPCSDATRRDAERAAPEDGGDRAGARLAQHVFARCEGDVNAPVPPDPVMRRVEGTAVLRGPFAADAMNCRQCHMVDDVRRARLDRRDDRGQRAYADFAQFSPIPSRGAVVTHMDGEFATLEDLVAATLTGRNFGWRPDEHGAAVRHVARVIRDDDGSGDLAEEFGGKYADVFAGHGVDPGFRLPPGYRIDVRTASDEQVLRTAARLVAAYLRSLDFLRDARGRNTGSAYDAFLRWNRLPDAPRGGEGHIAYAVRLRRAVERLERPVEIDHRFGELGLHRHTFAFGAWNVFGDPSRTRPHWELRRLLGIVAGLGASDDTLLARAIAAFKTPTLRDLGHTGRTSTMARRKRSPPPSVPTWRRPPQPAPARSATPIPPSPASASTSATWPISRRS